LTALTGSQLPYKDNLRARDAVRKGSESYEKVKFYKNKKTE
jgi:hypothetical protein